MWRANSLEKTLMLGKTEGKRRKGRQKMRLLDGIIDSVDMSLSQVWETVKDREAWHVAVLEVAESDMTDRMNNDNSHPWICRSDFPIKLPAASIKITLVSGNDFSRAATTGASRSSCSVHPATQNSHLNSADPIAAFFIILHPSLSPVGFCQVLPLSLRSKISYSCFSQTHKTPLQLVFYLGVGGSFLFNLH